MTCDARHETGTLTLDRDAVLRRFNVSRETAASLDRLVAMLRQWQTRINLIGRSTLDDVWGRHIADSLQLADLASASAKTWLDLGSGAGFPGLVLAITLKGRAGLAVHLVESNARKAAFLKVAAGDSGAAAIVHNRRIEDLAADPQRPRPDVITARALAPLPDLLALACPFMGKNTLCLFPKGQDVAHELTECATSWKISCETRPSRIDPAASILRIEEIKRHDGRKRIQDTAERN